MSFPDTNSCPEMEKIRGFDPLIFRHLGLKLPEIEGIVFTRQEMLNSNKNQPTNQKAHGLLDQAQTGLSESPYLCPH